MRLIFTIVILTAMPWMASAQGVLREVYCCADRGCASNCQEVRTIAGCSGATPVECRRPRALDAPGASPTGISCQTYTRNQTEVLTNTCREADLSDPSDPDYCTRVDFGTNQPVCEFNASRSLCVPRPGAPGMLCERVGRAQGYCAGECPGASIFQAPPTPTEVTAVAEQVLLPRLQVDVPGLQPFTKPRATQEGEQVFLNIGFIGQYIIGLYKYLVGIVGILAGVIYTWAGIRWLISGGDPEKIQDSKKKIAGATMGMVLVLGSYLILYLVNPALTVFQPLRIQYVKRAVLIMENKPLPDSESSNAPAGTYDPLLQKYANCVSIDWRVLRMIAQKESGLNPNLVNRAGFIGLFQTKPVYCKSAMPAQFEDKCTEELLKNPSINIAVGARQQRKTLELIDKLCPNGEARAKFTIVYGVLNSGIGATSSAINYANRNGGCTVDNLRAGFVEFWKNYKGGATARWFIGYHGQNRCSAYPDQLDCMGAEKYNHTLRAADALVAQGVTAVKVEPTATCPLDTENPFPTS